jgi:predicted alpha/beta hydrolase family esterase
MTVMQRLPSVVMIHGAPGYAEEGWQPQVRAQLNSLGFAVESQTLPDSDRGRCAMWIPHLESMGIDEQTVLIGWSTGAVAAMRYAQRHRILGSVLVGAYSTDLGDPAERDSGWFIDPWDWEAIKANQQFILQFASTDDDLVPIAEQRVVRDHLDPTYVEHTDRGHYILDQFDELVPALQAQLAAAAVRVH